MAMDISDMKLPVQKFIDLGIIDNWFRGLTGLAPQRRKASAADTAYDFNRHTLSHGLVTQVDIEKSAGLRSLLQACSKNDIRVEITQKSQNSLEVVFTPDSAFAHSRVFGNGPGGPAMGMLRRNDNIAPN